MQQFSDLKLKKISPPDHVVISGTLPSAPPRGHSWSFHEPPLPPSDPVVYGCPLLIGWQNLHKTVSSKIDSCTQHAHGSKIEFKKFALCEVSLHWPLATSSRSRKTPTCHARLC